MIVVATACVLMLAVAAVLCLIRIERGPSVLDRAVAFDVLTASLVCAVGVEAALNRDVDTVPVLVVLSLVGFIGSVAVSRFAASEPPAETGGSGAVALGSSDPGAGALGAGTRTPGGQGAGDPGAGALGAGTRTPGGQGAGDPGAGPS